MPSPARSEGRKEGRLLFIGCPSSLGSNEREFFSSCRLPKERGFQKGIVSAEIQIEPKGAFLPKEVLSAAKKLLSAA